MPDTVQDLIRKEATAQGLPPELALAVADQESGFNPTATNPTSGAIGTFQFLPETAKGLGIDPADPRQNISGGVKYLRQLMDRHNGNLEDVLKEYGGVRTDTTYVPGVLARIPKFKSQTPSPKSQAPESQSTDSSAPPVPKSLTGRAMEAGIDIARGFDPRTAMGRRNLAGGVGAGVAAWLAPEVALPVWLSRALAVGVPLSGAYAGGAAETGVEQAGQAAIGAPPPPQGRLKAIQEAGREQMGNEALGQAVAWPLKGVGRRVMQSKIATGIAKGFGDAVTAIGDRLQVGRTAVSPAQAGLMVESVAQGPAKAVREHLGEQVAASAEGGPPIPAQPLRDRLQELSQQITPQMSHEPTLTSRGEALPATVVNAIKERNPEGYAQALAALPPDHPLPATLNALRETIGEAETIPFGEAHKMKILLDNAVHWDRQSSKVAEQVTKGARQTLRQLMSSHEPYNEATAAYRPVAKLYEKGLIPKLHRQILDNPEGFVKGLDWRKPTAAKLAKNLTVDVAAQAGEGGGQMGEAAWNATRAAWTHENLIAKGPERMLKTMQQMEGSNSGQEFIDTMYGDASGQTVWNNLKRLGAELEKVKVDERAFSESKLAAAHQTSSAVRDLAYAALPGHPITKVGAVARVVFGPSAKEMIQWASYSTSRTEFLIKHVLTGPDPGMAFADMVRWWENTQGEPDKPLASHPPPKPTSVH